ncbi:branched-chain amino acid ABC transporter permease [Zavarzinia compransoris]|uniref:Branched-chain amino acid ABC transporter permease n=1 Tax=Zavarzinia compransoris TaxID=1264899 RepID=A0A317E1P8_9PROT|nr:branched-chain amino acid ABC transporter permease [Zavarzinia compransoris]PWR20998.1 branched-chain amino acid ABC transporter permease [Zavarzinia compransoris]TDP44030.1 amino acid/amide ABC transporter membrane protein 1 (HAAT family) [Zavarzinia compransoris]
MLVHILNGLVHGGMLYVMSVGLVMIFGLRRVVNFAHGALYMLGAYVGYAAAVAFGFWVALPVAALALAALGVVLDRMVFRTLQKEDPIVTVLVTFGILLVLEDVVRAIWGKDLISFPMPELLSGSIAIGDVTFPVYRLAVIVAAVLVAGGLSAWLRFTRAGLYVRASSVDPVTTAMQGVDTERLSMLVVAVGTGLAGLSGVIAAPLIALSPSMGASILIESFIVVVTGGLGSFGGAFIAALVIGQLHNLGVVYTPNVASMIPLMLMVAVLIWRPNGIVRSAH